MVIALLDVVSCLMNVVLKVVVVILVADWCSRILASTLVAVVEEQDSGTAALHRNREILVLNDSLDQIDMLL